MAKRMKVLLVRVPEIEFRSQSRDIRSIAVSSLTVPMGITYIASVIRADGNHDVKIFDLYAEHYRELVDKFQTNPTEVLNISKKGLIAALDDYLPDIVGLSASFNFQHSLVKELAETAKKHRPEARVYLGGYATVFPEVVLGSMPDIDVLFIGESEITIKEVLRAESEGGGLQLIKGIAGRIGGDLFVNKTLNFPAQLDSIPYPAYDMLPLDAYRNIFCQNEMPLMTSRGCPFVCNYCSGHLYSGRRLRLRGLENLMSEIELLRSKYNMDFLWVRDDNLIVNKHHAKQFLREIIRRSLAVPWCDTSAFHVNSLDEELLTLCKESGCTEVIFAIESGSPRVLKDIMNKNVDLDHARKMAKFCRSIDLPLQCYFVVGNPGETKEEIQMTVDYALELEVDRCTFSIATPFPGTQYYDLAKEKGYLVHDPEYILGMKYMEANMQTEQFTSGELKDIQYDANMRVNFLENRLLRGDSAMLKKALEKFTRIADQYQFHAVAHILKGYLHGVLGNGEESKEVFQHVQEMLKDKEIEKAYGKYFSWNSPAIVAFRKWQKTQELLHSE